MPWTPSTKWTMTMTIKHRLDKLEATTPDNSEPLEVFVTRTVVVPGPEGPVPVGRVMVSHYVDGKLVDRQKVGL